MRNKLDIVNSADSAFFILNLVSLDPRCIFSLVASLGKLPPTKTDEFSEKFQTAFDPPPPHFRKIMLRIFYKAVQP